MIKFCPGCEKEKDIEEFHKHRGRKDGRQAYCKHCDNSRSNKFYEDSPIKRWLAVTKNRAKNEGFPFNLVEEDITIPEICPILGIVLKRNKRKLSYDSPSIDKIRPKLGYVKGNIQVISQRANVMKNDATPEELLKFADWVYKTYKKE
jgi:hypothetical protein